MICPLIAMQVSGANAAQALNLDVTNYDALLVMAHGPAGIASALTLYDNTGPAPVQRGQTTLAGTVQAVVFYWERTEIESSMVVRWSGGDAVGSEVFGLRPGGPLPTKVRLEVGAGGVGIATTIMVAGRPRSKNP